MILKGFVSAMYIYIPVSAVAQALAIIRDLDARVRILIHNMLCVVVVDSTFRIFVILPNKSYSLYKHVISIYRKCYRDYIIVLYVFVGVCKTSSHYLKYIKAIFTEVLGVISSANSFVIGIGQHGRNAFILPQRAARFRVLDLLQGSHRSVVPFRIRHKSLNPLEARLESVIKYLLLFIRF